MTYQIGDKVLVEAEVLEIVEDGQYHMWSAWSAEWSAAYDKYANELLRLLADSKPVEGK